MSELALKQLSGFRSKVATGLCAFCFLFKASLAHIIVHHGSPLNPISVIPWVEKHPKDLEEMKASDRCHVLTVVCCKPDELQNRISV